MRFSGRMSPFLGTHFGPSHKQHDQRPLRKENQHFASLCYIPMHAAPSFAFLSLPAAPADG